MTKKIGNKKIGGVKSTGETKDVEGAEAVGGISGVQATASVGGVKGTGGIGKRRPTHAMTLAEREQLFKMISEEADKLFGDDEKSQKGKQLVASAVKMAVDVGLLPEDEDELTSAKKGTKK